MALDGEWVLPFGRFTTTTVGAHASHEKDYDSAGVNGRFSFELMEKLLTLTVGGGVNEDSVSPIGGTPDGLSDGTVTYDGRIPSAPRVCCSACRVYSPGGGWWVSTAPAPTRAAISPSLTSCSA